MKRAFVYLLICIISVSLTGCGEIYMDKHEINEIDLIRAVGLDNIGDNNIRMILPLLETQSTGGRGSSESSSPGQSRIVNEDGRTIFEAEVKVHSYLMKDLSWHHVQFVIIGEEAAKEDIVKYFDFITRDHEPRLSMLPLIAENDSAENIIDQINTSNTVIAKKLKTITDGTGARSVSSKLELHDLIKMLDNKYASSYIPSIRLVKRIERQGEDKDKKDVELNGYAIIKGRRLIGYINDDTARGLNFIKNKAEDGVIILKDKNGNQISMEMLGAHTDIIPKIKDNKLEVDIKVEAGFAIAEYEGYKDIFDKKTLDEIVKAENKIVKQNIDSVVNYAKKNKADFMGIGDSVYHKYPVEWDDYYKKNWEDNFANIKINIDVKSKVSRAFNLREVTRGKENKK